VGVVEFCYIEKQIFVLLRSTLLRYQNPIALCLTSFPKILYENKPQPNNDYKYKKGPSKGDELVDGIIMKTSVGILFNSILFNSVCALNFSRVIRLSITPELLSCNEY
jgi:hypothetical protein